jgi:hypothetical protein
MDMKALLVALCAALVVTHNAEAVRVPDPDPEQGDGRVSAFYTWGDEIPSLPASSEGSQKPGLLTNEVLC